MMPIDKRPGAFRALKPVALLALTLALPGCVYRPNIQQGNLLEASKVDEVTVGMTRSQVRYLLGTPMVSDPFDAQRWDYVYTFRQGRSKSIDRAHFVVHFEGDKVSRVEKLDQPEESEAARQIRRQRELDEQQPAPAPLPSEAPRPPDTAPPETTP
jgi:outer membrane protein assembly factor BamE